MNNETIVLEWDSIFFSLRIASITLYNENFTFLENCLVKYKKENFDLVYVFLNDGIILPSSIQHLFSSKLVDNKCIYSYTIPPHLGSHINNIHLFNGYAFQLYDLAVQSGIYSRYNTDNNFQRGDFERLYKTWIEKSVDGTLADKVLVHKTGNVYSGLITLKQHNNEVSIGLIATDSSYRRKGVGSSLLDAAKSYAYTMNKTELNVATQAHNTEACSLYEKNSFVLKSKSLVYHIWLK